MSTEQRRQVKGDTLTQSEGFLGSVAGRAEQTMSRRNAETRIYTCLFHRFPHSVPCASKLDDDVLFGRGRSSASRPLARWFPTCEKPFHIRALDASILSASWGKQRDIHPVLPRKVSHRGQRKRVSRRCLRSCRRF